jgi:myo-inositol 2-dehydrogenase / D-chiro-inositol 1-dehydrogenase
MRIGLAGVGRIGAEHARALHTHPDVDELVITDADAGRAARVAGELGIQHAPEVRQLLASGIDALVIAAATDAHADLILAGIEAGLPVFCEKPVAGEVKGTIQVRDRVAETGANVHIGFQRRFDAGYSAARQALASGALGGLRRMHVITADPAPPSAEYIAASGGAFRDMLIHDFDAVRWVSGRDVVEVYATGANRGAEFFASAGDVDEAAALLTLDDGTLCTVQGSRYNGAGYDVRMELAGTEATWVVGLDDALPVRSAQPGVDFPAGPPVPAFWPRFVDAYRAEMTAFVAMARGETTTPCSVQEALEALFVAEAADLSLREHRPVRIEEVRAAWSR